MDSIRQQQIAKHVQQALVTTFQVHGRDIYGGAFVTISEIKVTPDLQIAKVYLSVYNVEDKLAIVNNVSKNGSFLRKKVGEKIRKKVRHIPELHFYIDETLDEVFNIDKLFKKIKDEEE